MNARTAAFLPSCASPTVRRWWLAVCVVATGLLGACRDDSPAIPPAPVVPEAPSTPAAPPAPAIPAISSSAGRLHFASVASECGLDFTYQNGAQGQLLMVESLGGGAGWLDYDRDGLLDVYLCQGGDPAAPDPHTRPIDQLYRQRSIGQFASVTEQSRTVEHVYGQGVAVGDFDNDGFPDIYVTNCGHNSFFVNQGDGTFAEVAASLHVDDDRWSSSAAWGDLDLDGDLDLYVCNYLQYDPYHPFKCEKDGQPALCHPRQIPHWPDECFENMGDGTFQPRAATWHLGGEGNKGLGVAITDFNNDGWPDIYVANDTTANFLFINQSGQDFDESALRLGAALSGDGAMQASMGVAVGDYDRSGTFDICLTHFTGETNTLYQNLGEFGFNDVSGQTGLYQLTFSRLGFGTVMADLDANGSLEMIFTNGHIDDRNADGDGYEQRPMLLTWNGSKWLDVSVEAAAFFQEKRVGRGIARGDYDADGDDDLLIVHQNTPTVLLRNECDMGHWLRLKLIGRAANRFGIGTRVTITQGNSTHIEELMGGTSYCSTHEPVIPVALGVSLEPVQLEIRWPGGRTQKLTVEQFDQVLTLVEPPRE